MLRLYREVPIASTPLGDGLLRPSQARMPGLTPHHPPTTAGSTPIKREPEEVEGARTFPAPLPRPWARKRNQAGLVRVQGQSVALKPLDQYRVRPFGIVVSFECDDKIIALSDERRLATKARLDFPLKPHVEHVVQVNVSQQR